MAMAVDQNRGCEVRGVGPGVRWHRGAEGAAGGCRMVDSLSSGDLGEGPVQVPSLKPWRPKTLWLKGRSDGRLGKAAWGNLPSLRLEAWRHEHCRMSWQFKP